MCKDGIYRHPKHCSGFYHCLGGVEFPVQFCQTGLLFNPTIAACDWPKNVDCSKSWYFNNKINNDELSNWWLSKQGL